jgi:hypothetical protein
MMSKSPHSTVGLLLLGACAALIAGCKDRRIESYVLKKEPRAEVTVQSGGGSHAGTNREAGAPDAASPLVWTAPAHWIPKPASAMRRASFDVPMNDGPAADFSIFSFGGTAGGVLNNVNRWRVQLGLASLPSEQLAANRALVAANGLTFTVVDFAGQTNGASVRLLAAITEYGGDTWFFKLTGADVGVAGEKAAFLTFLHTVKSR